MWASEPNSPIVPHVGAHTGSGIPSAFSFVPPHNFPAGQCDSICRFAHAPNVPHKIMCRIEERPTNCGVECKTDGMKERLLN